MITRGKIIKLEQRVNELSGNKQKERLTRELRQAVRERMTVLFHKNPALYDRWRAFIWKHGEELKEVLSRKPFVIGKPSQMPESALNLERDLSSGCREDLSKVFRDYP